VRRGGPMTIKLLQTNVTGWHLELVFHGGMAGSRSRRRRSQDSCKKHAI
jgi:hypothetical protein